MPKTDPYAALRIKEFNIFLLVRFVLVFAWSMQFIVIEWEVYSMTKDPLSLGLIGLMEIIPAVSMALFAGHIVDQKEKRNLLVWCIALFSLISLGLFLLTWDKIVANWDTKLILYGVYAFSERKNHADTGARNAGGSGTLLAFPAFLALLASVAFLAFVFWPNHFFFSSTYSTKKGLS